MAVTSDPDWRWIGDQVERRRNALGLSREEIPKRGTGATISILYKIERAVQAGYQARTLIRVARALDWPDDAFERYLFVGEVPPSLTAEGETPSLAQIAARLEDLSALVLELLARQEQLKSALNAPDGSGPGGIERRRVR